MEKLVYLFDDGAHQLTISNGWHAILRYAHELLKDEIVLQPSHVSIWPDHRLKVRIFSWHFTAYRFSLIPRTSWTGTTSLSSSLVLLVQETFVPENYTSI